MARQEPISLLDFQERFATDVACHEQLFKMRWPDGFRCPRCGGQRSYWLQNRSLYQCTGCRYQSSITAGTVFHRSRVPLRKWFWTIFLCMHDKRGVSALLISRALSIRYETAWFMLHKIRQAMQNREAQYQLDGLVEMDDGYFGGVDHGRYGRGVKSSKVVVAVGLHKRRPTYAKMGVVSRMTKQEIGEFARRACHQGTVIRTDGLTTYQVVEDLGYYHHPIIVREPRERVATFPTVHTFISNVKAWLLGTFHGAVGPKYLQRYLDEYSYRFNRRRFKGQEFARLLHVCANMAPTTYAELTG